MLDLIYAYFQVIKALLEISRKNSWAELVHCKLISILANMFYQVEEGSTADVSSTPVFLVEQIDLIGGFEFIFLEVHIFILFIITRIR